MGRESSGDPHSSIALLQERFRQLQRVKEMREEREHHQRAAFSDRDQRPKWFLHPDLVHYPSRPLNSPGALRAGFPSRGTSATSISTGLWPERPPLRGMGGSDEMDVDTSLHL
uniref:Polyprotein n=1 Tax=Anthurium amnicola TaxID=1678845 RepID=A0A1D1Z2Y3_9ARAE